MSFYAENYNLLSWSKFYFSGFQIGKYNIKESSSSWSLVSLWCMGVWVKTPLQGDTLQLNSAGLSAMSCHMSQVYRADVSVIATGLWDGAELHLHSRLHWELSYKGDL